MTAVARRQLSLFALAKDAASIEAVRAALDPVQHALIAAHVTLCRDAETEDVLARDGFPRVALGMGALTLTFGAAELFDGHGVRLPCIAGAAAFAALRERVMGGAPARVEAPHITLAHPRNPPAATHALARAHALSTPFSATFTTISLISQTAGAPWQVVAQAPL